MTKILFTICGRAGSKGIKNKNLRTFCGKPLAYFTVSVIDLYLRKHGKHATGRATDGYAGGHTDHTDHTGHATDVAGLDAIEAYVVGNSDSQELLHLLSNNGLITIDTIERDASLAGDVIGKIAVIEDCLNQMEAKHKKSFDVFDVFDVVVDLDITSPLRTVADLERVINKHMESGADVTTTVAPARRNPYFNQVKKTEHGFKKVIESDFTARQQAPEIYDMNASIYAYKPDYLRSAQKTGKGVLDGYCEMVEMYDTAVLDLDHENDFELMEVVAEHLFKTNPDFRIVYENTPEKERNMYEEFLEVYKAFLTLTANNEIALSSENVPLCSMPFTARIFSDCIKDDVEAVLALKRSDAPYRYAEGIIRNVCEQTIEFIYLYHNQDLLGEYYGADQAAQAVTREKLDKSGKKHDKQYKAEDTEDVVTDDLHEPNIIKQTRKLIGLKRYSNFRTIRDKAVAIGEEIGTDTELSLYEIYEYLSAVHHNSYRECFMEVFFNATKEYDAATDDANDANVLVMNDVETTENIIAEAVNNVARKTTETAEKTNDELDTTFYENDTDFSKLATILTKFMGIYQKIVGEN